MFKKSNISQKSQQPSVLISNKYFSNKLTTFSPQTPASFQGGFGNPLKGTYKTYSLFFTFNSPHKSYGYQQRFFSTSKLDPIEWQTLLKKLRDNKTSLNKLKLQDKQLDDAGAKELAMALKTNETLRELDLSYNQIGAMGAKEVAIALKTNHTLTMLDLGYNQVGDEGAKALAVALKTNCTLRTLNLKWNEITDMGARELATALEDNHTLTSFELKGEDLVAFGNGVGTFEVDEKISDVMVKEIDTIIRRNYREHYRPHNYILNVSST